MQARCTTHQRAVANPGALQHASVRPECPTNVTHMARLLLVCRSGHRDGHQRAATRGGWAALPPGLWVGDCLACFSLQLSTRVCVTQ